MHITVMRRVFIAALTLVLFAAACGSDTSETLTTTESAVADDTESMDDMDHGDDADHGEHGSDSDHGSDSEHGSDSDMAMGDGGHDHGMALEVSADLPTPSLTLEVIEDPKSGWNIHATPANHVMSPLSASTEHVDGEGHMHLYVDGERIGRLYTEWFHIGELGAGEHDIRVELSSNSHAALALDGSIIDQTVTITESADDDASGHGHGDMAGHAVSGDGLVPGVALQVIEDPKSGWNVNAIPSEHALAPESASTEYVEGEGHMHLYVDGTRVTRLYGEWYHLGDLTDGDHEIRVELSGNDHQPLMFDGDIIDATVTITQVDGTGSMDSDSMDTDDHAHGDHTETADGAEMLSTADQVLTISVADGSLSGDTNRQSVASGSMVGIVVTSDVADEVHVHGYDLLRPVGPGQDATFVFEADIPGLFEVELEDSGVLLLELLVS